jgi:hypothetical protein
MTAHATRARDAGGAADSDLLLDVLVKLLDAGDIAIQTVNFVGEVVKFFNDSLIVVLRSLGQGKESWIWLHRSCQQHRCNDECRDSCGGKNQTRLVGPIAALQDGRE